jgi:two-component system, OmpR family, response regulator
VPKICRVLVVEDNGDIRELLGELFAREGYRFALVEDGAAMRRELAVGDVDVVIVDVLLRGESGFDLAREAAMRGCGVVLTTGDHRRAAAIAASGHRFILKPYRLEALLATVETALAEVQARCEVKARVFGA